MSASSSGETWGCSEGSLRNPAIPRESPYKTRAAKDDEDGPPMDSAEHRGDEKRRESAGRVRARKEDALDPATVLHRDPARKRSRYARPRAGLARAEQETYDPEGV